jgi:cell division protein FtsB
VLKDELSKMEKDSGYVEKKAREKLGIIEKGEVVYKKGK